MWSEVLQVQDREVVGSCGSRVLGGADGFSDCVVVERMKVMVQFMTVAETAHYSAGLRFAFMCRDAGELSGEAFGYGGLFGAGFGGSVWISEGDGLVWRGAGVPAGQCAE